jgi:hypothetical protein
MDILSGARISGLQEWPDQYPCSRQPVCSLHPQQYFPVFPQFFQFVITAEVLIEKMYNDIAVIHHHPASLRFPFDATFPLVV